MDPCAPMPTRISHLVIEVNSAKEELVDNPNWFSIEGFVMKTS